MFERQFARFLVRAVVVSTLVGAVACTDHPTAASRFTVTGVTPNLGSTVGPTEVRIGGTGFTSGARVAIDGVDAPVSAVTTFSIAVTVPRHAIGHAEIVVTNGDGSTLSVPNGFTYAALVVDGLSPNEVLVTGGQITINGSGFLSSATVTIDRVPVTPAIAGGSRLLVSAPAHAAGAVDVTVINPFGETITLPGALTYKPTPPVQIDRVEPAVGSTAGGTFVAIFGTPFVSLSAVTIDGQNVHAEIGDFNALYIDTPPHAAGPVDIVVTNPGGSTQQLRAGFRYAPADTFSFEGVWDTYVRPLWNSGPGFRVENNTVTGLFCVTEVVNLIPTPPPVVTDGAFSFVAKGGGQIQGHVVADGEAAGTISVPGCRSGTWYGYRRR